MPTYAYPTAAQLMAIDPVHVATTTANDPIFRFFPPRPTNFPEVYWEQRDNYKGLMQFRGYGAEPKQVPRVGAKRYRAAPGVYGEFGRVDEEEMTRRAAYGTWDQVLAVDDLVESARMQTLTRQIQRISWLLWRLASTGQYVVLDELGSVADYGGFQLQTFVAPVPWSTPASAAPLANYRSISTLGRGLGTSFNGTASGFSNQTTFNYLLANTNSADLGGKRTSNGSTINGPGALREVMAAEGAPTLTVYDEGYFDDANSYTLYIPDGVVVVFGVRVDGNRIGEFQYTSNAVNPGRTASPYIRVVEKGMRPGEAPPPVIDVHRGFNGGPAVHYPGNILLMKVA